MLGTGASAVLTDAFGQIHASIGEHRLRQIRYSPGRSVVAELVVEVTHHGGRVATEEVAIAAGHRVAPGAVARVSAFDTEFDIWRYPYDPYLPGLRVILDADRRAEVLEQLGLPGASSVVRHAYRASRRAVFEITQADTRFFVKVVRPHVAERVVEAHRHLASVLTVPHVHGWSPEAGIVVLGALTGKPLRAHLQADRGTWPEPEQVVELLHELRRAQRVERTAVDAVERTQTHCQHLGTLLPSAIDQLARIQNQLSTVEPAGDRCLVHGDFHSGQILVADGRVQGLIDLDTLAMGESTADPAALLGQLHVLAALDPSNCELDNYLGRLVAMFDETTSPPALRARTAAVILGLATGPFRVQEKDWRSATAARIDLAETWANAAVDHS